MNEPNFDPRVIEFCERLEQLGPGERARLKRNAGRALAESRNVMGLFFRLLPRNVPQYQEETYFLVATLFPLARKDGEGNLGHALYHARDPKYAQGLDRRVEVLLDADREQLPFRLRQAIRFIDSKRIPVNWPWLLQDLLAWDQPKHYVQEAWARAYFANE
jgi:CRISPR type I-E-associated protein CasB/Cse2